MPGWTFAIFTASVKSLACKKTAAIIGHSLTPLLPLSPSGSIRWLSFPNWRTSSLQPSLRSWLPQVLPLSTARLCSASESCFWLFRNRSTNSIIGAPLACLTVVGRSGAIDSMSKLIRVAFVQARITVPIGIFGIDHLPFHCALSRRAMRTTDLVACCYTRYFPSFSTIWLHPSSSSRAECLGGNRSVS